MTKKNIIKEKPVPEKPGLPLNNNDEYENYYDEKNPIVRVL